MNTLNIGRRYPVAGFVMVLMAMALLAAMFVNTVDAAPVRTEVSIGDRIKSQTEDCNVGGGSAITHYEFDLAGDVISADVTCNGGDFDGMVCDNTNTTIECYMIGRFVQPTQPVVPEQRPDTAAPVENPQQTFPIVGDIAVPPGGVAEDPTGNEQARIAEDEAAE